MGIGEDGFTAIPLSSITQENGLYQPEGEYHSVPLCNPEGSQNTGRPPDRGKPSLLKRPCFYLSSFVKALPVIFISFVIGWSYYAYVVAVLLHALASSPVEQVVCGVVYHCLAVMFLWSYIKVVVTPPGQVPNSWRLTPAQVERLGAAQSEEEWKSILFGLANQLGCNQLGFNQRSCAVKQRSVQGAVRYCEKCLCIKPDRSHHCSVCEVCTLKMDHHCPWVNNCVGFHNYKFFLLFLGYAVSYCAWIGGTTARSFVRVWLYREEGLVQGNPKYHLLFVFFVSILFSVSISSLFWYHLWLLAHNRSTLEQFRAPMFDNKESDADGWSLGKLNNVREVFGGNVWLWPLPLATTQGDGISFPTRLTAPQSPTYQGGQGLGLESVRAETPNRTLINPTLEGHKEGHVTSCQSTTVNGSLSPDQRGLTITPDSGVGETEVRLDSNGHTQTVIQTVTRPDCDSQCPGMR